MKRMISVILIICIALTGFAATAYAAGKTTATLQNKMDQMGENDIVRVQMWVYPPNISEDQLKYQAYIKAGLSFDDAINKDMEKMNRYIIARRHILFELQENECREVVGQIGIPDERVKEISGLVVIAYMTKSELEAAAKLRKVETILFDEYEEEPTEAPTEASAEIMEGELYLDKFKKQSGFDNEAKWYGDEADDLLVYRELYYHKDDNGETDWALIYASSEVFPCYPGGLYTVVGNRVYKQEDSYYSPFGINYGVYDVKKDRFFDVLNMNKADYPGFGRAFDRYATMGRKTSYPNETGRLIGDMDGDYELTIIDATLIQRCEVRMRDWPEDDLIDPDGYYNDIADIAPLTYYSDFDRDGERDSVDATKLQRYIIGMDG